MTEKNNNCVHQACPRPVDCHYYCMDRHARVCVAARQNRSEQAGDKCEHGILWSMECLSCGYSDFERADLLPQPQILDKLVAEIRARQIQRSKQTLPDVVRPGCTGMYADIETLLSLLQQPATSEPCGECRICGHVDGIGDEGGLCAVPVPVCFDHYHGTRPCGCSCVFPTTPTCKWIQDGSDYRWYKTACGRETDSFDGGYCTYCGKVITIEGKPLEPVATTGAGEGSRDTLADECQRRMDAVVQAAVEWHQSGREGDNSWFEKSEALSAAIEALLELRDVPATVAGGKPQSRNPLVTCNADDPPPHDGSECEYSVCPRPRVCFHYCEQHHKSICVPAPVQPPAALQDKAREHAHAVVGTVFKNTSASYETLERVMIERITDYLTAHFQSTEEATQVAVEAARTAASEWMNTHHASFETNQKREDALVAIITKHYTTDAGEVERPTTPLLRKIFELADLGSAQEFNDAQERLRAIRGLIVGENV